MDIIKPFIENLLYKFMEIKRGNHVRTYIDDFKKNENISENELYKLQKEKLCSLLLHCINHVPAYKRLINLKTQIIASPFHALKQFPILTKEIFRADSASFIAENIDQDILIKNSSSGSSGKPIQFYMDRFTVEHYEAARWRGLSWYGITPGSRCLMIWANPADLNKIKTYKNLLIERFFKNRQIILASNLKPNAIKYYVQLINKYRPEYLYGYAGALTLFAQLILNQDFRPNVPIKAVVSTAETLYPEQREIIEQAFLAPVVNEYGARDGGIIGFQCPQGNLHLSSENLIAEIVSLKERKSLSNGERGLILITDLYNYVQPRIRYQIGDEVAMSTKSCECGRILPVISEVFGRENDILITIEGNYVHGSAFSARIKGIKEIKAFQIIQSSQKEVKVFFATTDGKEPPQIQKIKKEYQLLLPGTNISFKFVKTIPQTPSGKMRYTIRNFPLP